MWAGVELEKPIGKNNGSVNGISYFTCQVLKIHLKTNKNLIGAAFLFDPVLIIRVCHHLVVLLDIVDNIIFS